MWPVMYTFYYRRNVICTGRVIIETSIVVFKNLFYIYNLTTTMYLLFRFTELVMIFHQDLVLFYRYSVEFLCILNFKEILLKNCSHRIEKTPPRLYTQSQFFNITSKQIENVTNTHILRFRILWLIPLKALCKFAILLW